MEQTQINKHSFLRKWPWMLAILGVLGLLIGYYIRYQDNSQPGRATRIRLNKSVSDNIENTLDRNWYKITLPEDGCISLQFDHPVLGSDSYLWSMHLYYENKTTNVLGNGCWLVSGDKNELTEIIGLPAGTYYVKVMSYDNRCATSTYTLRVNYTESDHYETENNDSFYLADAVLVNEDYSGSMMSHRDWDCYVVTIPADGYVSIQLEHTLLESGPNWYLSLYESDKETCLNDEAWEIPSDADFTSDKYLLRAGTYYIRITRYVRYEVENIIGDYTLRVNFEPLKQ